MSIEEENFQKNDNFKLTMLPGAFAKRMRTCVVWQFIRFMALNIKILIVVNKSH